MGLKSEIYNPAAADDPELKANGGPYTAKFACLQVTARLPETNPINLVAMLYGFLPFALAISIPGFAIATNRFVYTYAICISLVCIILSEALLKPVFKDPRPARSANRYPDGRPKYGMPSGHALNVAGIMVWSLLEIANRQTVSEAWLAYVLALLAPVPWARVWNGDHTWAQVFLGLGVGACVGAGAYLIRQDYYLNHWFPWEKDAWATSSA